MPEFAIRPASKPEIKEITAWFIQERSKDARFVSATRGPWQRFMLRNWVLPRYLRSQAHTFVLEQDGRTAGFAVVEQMRESFTLSEFSIEAGFDEPGILRALTGSMEDMAREREYRYARAAPLDNSEPKLAMFRSLGYQAVDYYLWAFTGELTGSALGGEVALRPLNPKDGLERRIAILREELAASQVTTQEMIEASLFPQRPSTFPSFSVDLTAPGGGGEGQSIGYLSLRPNERQDDVLSIAISLQPAYWGAPSEAQAVLGAVYEHAGEQPTPVRVMISTTAHADRADALFTGLGLARSIDDRPILFKDLRPNQT